MDNGTMTARPAGLSAPALALRIALVVYVAEAIIMLGLVQPWLGHVSSTVEALIDATALTLVVAPIVYLWLLRPTRRALAERKRELAEQQRALDAAAPVCLADADGRIVEVNDSSCVTSGHDRKALIGRHWSVILGAPQAPEAWADLATAVARGDIWRRDIRCVRPDASVYWIDTHVIPLHPNPGRGARTMHIAVDITEKKHMHEAVLAVRVAEQANQTKTRSLSHMSHELRTPLSAVIGLADLLSHDGALTPAQRKKPITSCAPATICWT